MGVKEYNDDAIKNLALGIVDQAVTDYKRSLRDPKHFKYRLGLEAFFRSGWCAQLLGDEINHTWFLERIEEIKENA